MTITALPTRNEYTATAGQTVFSYTFKIFEDSDLDVYLTPSGQSADDTADIISAYTVTGVGDEDGGTIILTTPASAGDLITIVSDIPESRTTDYQNNGDFRPSVVNNDFDRVVSLVKQVNDVVDRSLYFQKSQQNVSGITMSAPEAGRLIRWKGDKSGFENVDISTPVLTPVASVAAMRNLSDSFSDGDIINLLGYNTPGDGGGGQFYWDATSTEADNGGTIIKVTSITTGRWKRIITGDIWEVEWFGLNEAAYQSAIDAVTIGSTLRSTTNFVLTSQLELKSNVTYIVDGEISTTDISLNYLFYATGESNINIKGKGKFSGVQGASTTTQGIRLESCTNVNIEGLSFDGLVAGIRMQESSYVEIKDIKANYMRGLWASLDTGGSTIALAGCKYVNIDNTRSTNIYKNNIYILRTGAENSSHINIDNVYCEGAETAGTYANQAVGIRSGISINVSNVVGKNLTYSLRISPETVGVDLAHSININNAVLSDGVWGVYTLVNTAEEIYNVNINNIAASNMTAAGFEASGLINSNVDNITAENCNNDVVSQASITFSTCVELNIGKLTVINTPRYGVYSTLLARSSIESINAIDVSQETHNTYDVYYHNNGGGVVIRHIRSRASSAALAHRYVVNNNSATDLNVGEISDTNLATAPCLGLIRSQEFCTEIGTISAGGLENVPLFEPNQNTQILELLVGNGSAITNSDTDYSTYLVNDLSANNIATATTQATGGITIGALNFVSLGTINAVHGLLSADEPLYFQKTDTAAGRATDRMKIIIRYIKY